MDQHADQRPFRLNVPRGSPARRLYERHEIVLESEGPVDVVAVARPAVAGKNETHD